MATYEKCEDKPDYCGGECHTDCQAERDERATKCQDCGKYIRMGRQYCKQCLEDRGEHITDADDCWCNPEIRVEGNAKVIIHNEPVRCPNCEMVVARAGEAVEEGAICVRCHEEVEL